ncbi:MAG TPA: DUF5050 domain-containing protein, partial [Thermoanaerobaculia bacterium]|nr:DUF5050 domain-containing protein [Thermoanaerobaculia bacterium]
ADVSLTADSKTFAATQENASFTLWKVPIDGGSPTRMSSGFNTRDGEVGIAALADGRYVFCSYASGKSLDIWISNADGSGRKRLTDDDASDERRPNISPDDKFLTYVRTGSGAEAELWRVDVTGENNRKLTDGNLGTVSPDSKWVYFFRGAGTGRERLFKISAEGGEPVQLSDRRCWGPNISPDGHWMLAMCADEGKPPKNVLWRLDGTGKTFEFPPTRNHHWSPDGKSFAYTGGESANIWLQKLDSSSPRKLTSFSDSGWNYAWSRDGKSLLVPRWQRSVDVVLLSPRLQ